MVTVARFKRAGVEALVGDARLTPAPVTPELDLGDWAAGRDVDQPVERLLPALRAEPAVEPPERRVQAGRPAPQTWLNPGWSTRPRQVRSNTSRRSGVVPYWSPLCLEAAQRQGRRRHPPRLAHAARTPEQVVGRDRGRHELDDLGLVAGGLEAQGPLGVHHRLQEPAAYGRVLADLPSRLAFAVARLDRQRDHESLVQHGTTRRRLVSSTVR